MPSIDIIMPEDYSNFENDLNKSSSSTADQSASFYLTSSSIVQCQLTLSDLQLSAELIENAIKDADLLFSLSRMSLPAFQRNTTMFILLF